MPDEHCVFAFLLYIRLLHGTLEVLVWKLPLKGVVQHLGGIFIEQRCTRRTDMLAVTQDIATVALDTLGNPLLPPPCMA
jgi:hypothetical protein